MKQTYGQKYNGIKEKLDNSCLNENEKRILRKIFKQNEQIRRHYFAAAFCLNVGVFVLLVSIINDSNDYIMTIFCCTVSLVYFSSIRRDLNVANIVKKLIDDDD